MQRRHLVVMVKEPRPGRVKTRLAAGLGAVGAAWWYRHQCAHVLRRLKDARWHLWLAVAPDREGLTSRVWPAHLPRLAQGQGDLGARMGRIFRSLPPGPAIIVGSDIPGISRAHIAAAFKGLGHAPSVLGPAPDGGYWLVGLRRTRVPAHLFEGVRWSSAHALTDTKATMDAPVAHAATLDDVDTPEDLQRLLAQHKQTQEPHRKPR
ncbi:MAG: TIGR04282 family arsenosugar biosynthesis glycosyltransferase [Pseudomonadota bacterium]